MGKCNYCGYNADYCDCTESEEHATHMQANPQKSLQYTVDDGDPSTEEELDEMIEETYDDDDEYKAFLKENGYDDDDLYHQEGNIDWDG